MNPHRPQTSRAHTDLLRELFHLERSGQFDRAFTELRGVWDDTTEQPNVEDLDTRSAAETFLRCGALIGFLGHIRQIPTAQERSKNLLTQARSIFLNIYDPEKIAECENYLALAYWRTGETNEAQNWIDEAQSHELAETTDARIYSFVIRDLVLLSQKKFAEVRANFSAIETLVAVHGDPFLTGSVYNNYGVASRNLGHTREALRVLEMARDLFIASGNKIQVALAENNLCYLYKTERRFTQAHAAIDRAIELFREIKDRTREGYSLDSKALLFFEQGNFESALETVEKALAILGRSENFAYLTDTLVTKAKIQLFSSDFSTATLTLLEAVDLAKMRISEAAATNLIREFEEALKSRNAGKMPEAEDVEKVGLASGDLKLILPNELAHYDGYQGIWISNSDLEPFGLSRGSLAVVVPTPVKRGDLIALLELETDSVSCGFYDADFGIICLEVGMSEPQLFDESAAKILGRIVGVCDAKENAEGGMQVHPLNL